MMSREHTLRLCFGVMIFFGVVFNMWFVSIPIGLVAMWIFPLYVEAIIAAFLHDMIFGISSGYGFHSDVYILCTAVVLGAFILLKKFVKR